MGRREMLPLVCNTVDLKSCQMKVCLSSSPPCPPFSSPLLVFSYLYSYGSESPSLHRVPFPQVQNLFLCLAMLETSEHKSSGSLQQIGQNNTASTDHLFLANILNPLKGDIVYLHVLGIGLVFINSIDAASDLMDKRGSIYSDKPSLVMAGELCVATISTQNELLTI